MHLKTSSYLSVCHRRKYPNCSDETGSACPCRTSTTATTMAPAQSGFCVLGRAQVRGEYCVFFVRCGCLFHVIVHCSHAIAAIATKRCTGDHIASVRLGCAADTVGLTTCDNVQRQPATRQRQH